MFYSEKEALKAVQKLRLEEQDRLDKKHRKHVARAQKHLLEEIEHELVESVIHPCKEWTDEFVANVALKSLDMCMNPTRQLASGAHPMSKSQPKSLP
mmetsp:Transcript_28033/g.73979  ORF Transcript_28033/g.73979 Transcript_28033/m.73979 type:complete len:97 (+) Transcript_28033:77-367(+)